jgi:hypothetical protein
MNRSHAVRLAAAAAVTGLVLGAAPAAHAEAVTVADPADASASLNDIREVTADHLARRLAVRVEVTDLRKHSAFGSAGMSLFIDTDRSQPGPELRLGTGLYQGTDYQLVRMEDWKVVSGPLSCRHQVQLDAAGDLVRFSVRRGCLGAPDEVRVGVKMVDQYDASHPITDWLKGTRKFTRWLDRG